MMSIKRVSETNKEPTKAVLTAEKQKGVRTIYVDNLDGWSEGTNEDTAVPFVMYAKNITTNEVISGSKTSWMGVVSKSSKTITNLILTGGEDQLYPAGTAVVATATAQWANELAEALFKSHNPDGSLKTQEILDNSISGEKLKDNTVDGSKIKVDSIEPVKLKQSNAQVIQSGNLATQHKTQQVHTQWFDQEYWNANFFRQRNEITRIEFPKAFKNPPAVAVQILNTGIIPLTVFNTVTTTTYVEFKMVSVARITQELDVTISVIATGELA